MEALGFNVRFELHPQIGLTPRTDVGRVFGRRSARVSKCFAYAGQLP